MIKTCLIHLILDNGINKFFDEVAGNFCSFNFNVELFSIGDFLQVRLNIKNKNVVLRSCKIESKNDCSSVIVSHDFSSPIRLTVIGGSIVDIKGDMQIIYNNFF